MKFVVIFEYTLDKERIAAVRPLHRQYLGRLRELGKLAICGPFTDDSGGLIVYETASREEAEDLIANDPFKINGIFKGFQVKPWNPVMHSDALFKTP